jgi:hypothetical protein
MARVVYEAKTRELNSFTFSRKFVFAMASVVHMCNISHIAFPTTKTGWGLISSAALHAPPIPRRDDSA